MHVKERGRCPDLITINFSKVLKKIFKGGCRDKVIIGQTSAEDWEENCIRKWLEMGGSELIEDVTLQFNEQKK